MVNPIETLLYDLLCERARQTKSCAVMGYDGTVLSTWDSELCPYKINSLNLASHKPRQVHQSP